MIKKFLLFLVLSICSLSIFAQPIDLSQQFNGRYDFFAIGNTLNTSENNSGNCSILTESSANLTLGTGQTLVSAKLYWSGSAVGDFDVKLNGTDVTAERTFSHIFNGQPYFAANADVTAIVEANGNGNYTFSDMDITSTISQYCGTNYGGWSIIIIYEDPSLLLNQVALFDGLEAVSANNNILNITLDNINAVSDNLSKIGFLAWEGDAAIANGESLFINTMQISNLPLNPPNNAFNSTNSYTNSNQLYNMDLDFYDLTGLIQPGDTQIDIQLTSQQDFIMVNNIITSVNSELPDATIAIDGITVSPQQDEIEITYTVSNVNSTNVLPANTYVSFYADNILLGEDFTNQDIQIGGTLTDVITISIPASTPSNFTLRAVIDGNGLIPETDEGNNEFQLPINLESIINPPAANLVVCDDDYDGFAWFDLSVQTPIITLGDPNLTVTYHGTFLDAENAVLLLPNLYINDMIYYDSPITDTTAPNYGTGGVWARVENITNNVINIIPFALEVRFSPVGNSPSSLYICDDTVPDGITFFDLTTVETAVLGSLDPNGFDLYYYENLADAIVAGDLAAINPDFSQAIPNPASFLNNTNPQTIYILLVSNANGTISPNPNSAEGCYDIVTLSLTVLPNPSPNMNPIPILACDDDNDGIYAGWDLTIRDAEILNGEFDVSVYYYNSISQAQAGVPGTEITGLFTNTVPFNQIVYARVTKSVPPAILPCYTIVELELIVNEIPPITQPINLFIDEGDGDGFAIFDLTENTVVMLAGLDPTDYIVTYYETEADATNNVNVLVTPQAYANTSNPQTIYVRVEDINTGCLIIPSFEILTDELAPDADGDGIANEDEDINQNGNLNDDDTDGDGIPNYLDSDDDGDTVQTIDETTGIGAGVAPTYIYIDTDGDGIENYLDNDDDGDGTPTIDEDYNNNGNPIDDDTNNNGIPDFLDDEVFLAVNSFSFEDLTIFPNPTSESFTIQSTQLVLETKILIYDIQGKVLFSEKMLPQNGALTVEVSSLENGVYFVKIASEGNSIVKKLIIE